MAFKMKLYILLTAAILSQSACPSKAQKALFGGVIQNGRNTVPYVQEFHALFPSANDALGSESGIVAENIGPIHWLSSVVLHGRYILTMELPITLNNNHSAIVKYGEPEFTLLELESVQLGNNGRVIEIVYGEHQTTFGKDQWAEIVESKGDFSAVGFVMLENRPVDNADKIR